MEYRKGPHHRSIITLLNETIFYSKFEVAGAIERWPSSRFVEGGGSKEMKLHVGRYTIIHLQVWGGARNPILVVRVLGRSVELPVLIFYRFRVVGPERRTGKERGYAHECTEQYTNNCHE